MHASNWKRKLLEVLKRLKKKTILSALQETNLLCILDEEN